MSIQVQIAKHVIIIPYLRNYNKMLFMVLAWGDTIKKKKKKS